ncbi:glyoxylate/hydroxypyruvate reductase A [Hoeflea sp. YIM 152468]|uniref:2-hydroxyacid dehydrogenase n=1 Tax=Hoeflea sp. YIM 152468 TaxID=3031759 RepID=UPI0023DAA1C7|nr:glyoxylate/hydroxypyruvate reductase A [Hoeflea sp. YIM 152468]MDF1610350.1 glyoxylate/hydroxypyruvate reductase A [Hoeflea sp. YIM 152468]
MADRHTNGRILLALTGWQSEIWIDELGKAAPDRAVTLEPEGEADPTIDYAVVWKQRPGLLSNLPNLKAIFSLGAGVDHIFADTSLPDVPIVRVVSPDLTTRMSEYVVWQVLDHHRRGPLYRAQQADRVWYEHREQTAASALTVGIMGLGELGRDAAAKLRVLGFQLSGWSRTEKQVDGVACHAGETGLGPFLASADIVVVLLPLTPDTRGILNHDLFKRMTRRGPLGAPVLINAGRGGLQSEADILSALDEGLLSAVTLDVFEQEPLAAESRLWSHPKVTLTPHAAAASVPSSLIAPIVKQMDALERGEALMHLVDRKAGY